MRAFRLAKLAFFVSVLVSGHALAWGVDGHVIIADIAEMHLSDPARRRVTEILQGARMRDVSSYADEYRRTHRESSRWHFLNVAPGGTDYRPERDCKYIPGQGDCLIAAIDRAIADVKTDGERQRFGLMFLIHFIGDIHQPLHIVAEARGGNDIPVTFFGFSSNLHKVWDSDMVRHVRRTPADLARGLDETYINASDYKNPVEGGPIDWAMQSRDIGLKALVASNSALGDEYYEKFTPIMAEQLARAGERLAYLLNELFQ